MTQAQFQAETLKHLNELTRLVSAQTTQISDLVHTVKKSTALMDQRMDRLEGRMTRLEAKINQLHERFDRHLENHP